jgi:hypothetical protein
MMKKDLKNYKNLNKQGRFSLGKKKRWNRRLQKGRESHFWKLLSFNRMRLLGSRGLISRKRKHLMIIDKDYRNKSNKRQRKRSKIG